MPNRCEFVDPNYNFPCGKPTRLSKIVIHYLDKKEPLIKYVCELHGDARFNYLSLEENNITKQKDQNKISYKESSVKMNDTRWHKCRRCIGKFKDTDIVCEMDFHWLKDTRISLRRSCLLHKYCLESELMFFSVISDDKAKDLRLTDFNSDKNIDA